MTLYILSLLAFMLLVGCLFYRHQRLLQTRAQLMKEAIRNHEFTFRLPENGLFFGECALQKTLNEMGNEINNLMAQNEVESWQKLTRVLTHEIMNATAPITSISQAYLLSPKLQGTVYEEGIRAIYNTSKELSTFVENYRKLTQLQEPNFQPVELATILHTLQALYPMLQWHIQLPPGFMLSLDENMFHQVLVNLIKNAIEAGATLVDVRWQHEHLWISNNGSLIPAAVAREIFIPFFTTKKTGSGIGLSLSKHLMLKQKRNLQLADTPVAGCHVSFIL